MSCNVVISFEAEEDIQGIYDYIKHNLCAPKAAARTANKIYEQIISLDASPKRYRLYDREPWKSRGLRKMPVDNFVVLYIVDENSKTVTVLRVFYGGRDIDKLIVDL